MSERLDPRIKQQIKLALESAMYAATDRRCMNKLHAIIEANSVKQGFSHRSFSYKGEFYNYELSVPRYKNQRLVPELHPRMNEWLAEIKQLDYEEKPYILGFFNKVLNASNSVLDYYQLLPECLHRCLDKLNLDPAFILSRELTDEQAYDFQLEHTDWILMLKKRMVLDLVMT